MYLLNVIELRIIKYKRATFCCVIVATVGLGCLKLCIILHMCIVLLKKIVWVKWIVYIQHSWIKSG